MKRIEMFFLPLWVKKVSFTGATILLVLFNGISVSSAYQLSGYKWPQPTATYYVDISGADGLWNDAFEGAMSLWGVGTNFSYMIVRDTYEDPCDPIEEGRNGVSFGDNFCGDSWGSTTLATTQTWYVGSVIIQSDIVFNSNESWNVYSTAWSSWPWVGVNDFKRVAVHELGHALGLGHEDSGIPTIMGTYVGNTIVPQQDDINGVAALYGPSTTTFPLNITADGTGEGIVTSTPSGISCGSDCSETYLSGSSVILSATPLSGSIFTGWSGEGCSGTEACLVSMTTARNVSATFDLISQPNLKTYTPTGWSDMLVISILPDTTIDSATITDDDTIYIDWAVINSGTQDSGAFKTNLYVDGMLKYSWDTTSLLAGHYISEIDYPVGPLSVGNHIVAIATDADGTISEIDETDNYYERLITIEADTDGDGVIDSDDAFPDDPVASIDADGDGYPDSWNDGYSQSDSTTGLALDEAPDDSTIGAAGTFLFFPHVDSGEVWGTEIGIINTGESSLQGTLYAYDGTGTELETKTLDLPVSGRVLYTVGDDFTSASQIKYIKFSADDSTCSGYEKFYTDTYRVAIPAVSFINDTSLNVSHIDSSSDPISGWWTGVALVNTTSSSKTVTFTFDDDSQHDLDLSAGEHWAGLISSFAGIDNANVRSAQISNADGIIGLELFGGYGNNYLSGILLNDQTASSLYYPHVASDETWWTGLVTYNPGSIDASLTISPYDADGTLLGSSSIPLSSKDKYIGTFASLGLPAATAWFKVDSDQPVSGFELFGNHSGDQLAGYTSVNISSTAGSFAKLEQDGWTGIAFVNTSIDPALVTLTALDNNGTTIATKELSLAGNEKMVNLAEGLFDTSISSATYIKFESDQAVVGFQLNGSSDDLRLDGLPGL